MKKNNRNASLLSEMVLDGRHDRSIVLNEDGVARRALSTIIQKAQDSGNLSPAEQDWAKKLTKAVNSSEGDSLKYPKLSLDNELTAADDKPGWYDKKTKSSEKGRVTKSMD